MSLAQVHRQAGDATTAGGRAAALLRGFASRIQNECNNNDLGAIRALCVQADEQADDIALTVEVGWAEAERQRGNVRDAAVVVESGTVPARDDAALARAEAQERERVEREEAEAAEATETARETRGTVANTGTVAGRTGTVSSAGTVTNTGTAGRR